ncbi:MAG: acyl-CoA thioesterase [Gammaproteobacteria bacterium]|nr:acyl-CoA thioesterase [Gammaproteobacteria bacterium]
MYEKNIIAENQELSLSTIPMPKDTNMQEAIFGGWTLAKIDLAGSVPARRIAAQYNQNVVTKAVNNVNFIAPIKVGDKVDFFTSVKHIGNTSITIDIEAFAERYECGKIEKVIQAEFVYVRVAKPQ